MCLRAQTFGVHLALDGYAGAIDAYTLAPPAADPMGLRSRLVALNGGAPLRASAAGELPPLPPSRAAAPLRLAPLTFGFLVLPAAAAPACL